MTVMSKQRNSQNIRFIHTSDWQIGKVFRFVNAETMGVLQKARLDVIDRLGEIATENEIRHILVAGDVYDIDEPSTQLLNQPLERIREFQNVEWHLLPGNHDPHRSNGLWDRILKGGKPDNIRVYLEQKPELFEQESFAVLPAPLYYKRTTNDPTQYMDTVDVSSELTRIGLAHGSVEDFGATDQSTTNYINPNRPKKAGLSYLALGDWHGQKEVNEKCWYSGTPETDAFDVKNGGKALIVEITSQRADPDVRPIETGCYEWVSLSERINSRDDIDHLENRIRNLGGGLNRHLVDLEVKGLLSLEDFSYFRKKIVEGVSAALCFMRINRDRLRPKPTDADIRRVNKGEVVRVTFEKLIDLANNGSEQERKVASEAIIRLYFEAMDMIEEQEVQ